MFRNLPLAVRQVILAFAGLSAGGVIAAGIFAFLVMIGIFPRLIGKTKTRKHILLFDTMIILGGILGNAVDLYEIPVLMGGTVFGSFWIFRRRLCGMSCHVSGRNSENGSGDCPEDSPGCGLSLSDSVNCRWKAGRRAHLFSVIEKQKQKIGKTEENRRKGGTRWN